MNDLMTNSFLNYVELKKLAQADSDPEPDIEKGRALSPMDESNLSQFFQEVDAIKSDMEEITDLLSDLRNLNEETKTTLSPKLLRGLRDRMDSDMVSVLRKANVIKARLECLDRSNAQNRRFSVSFREGGAVDRTRVSVTNGLRNKLRDMMIDFQVLRDAIVSDHKEYLRRRYYNETGEVPSEELIEKMFIGCGKVEAFEGRFKELILENKERHEAVLDIQRSLNKLHQVFLDMAVLVDTQGDKINDIEENVAVAGSFVSGGTDSLFYAKQMKKKNDRKWMCFVLAVVMIILLVCFIATLSS